MKPIRFEETNADFAKNQPEYKTLPGHIDSKGVVTICYHLSAWDRIKLLFMGKLWLRIMTFNRPLMPHILQAEKPVIRKKVRVSENV